MPSKFTLKKSGNWSFDLSPEQICQILSFNIKYELNIKFNISANNYLITELTEPVSKTSTTWETDFVFQEIAFRGWNGSEITKKLMANRLALYDVFNCQTIKAPFRDDGVYAFGRYGFLPHERFEWKLIRENILDILDQAAFDNDIAPDNKKVIRDILEAGDEMSFWNFIDISDKDFMGHSFAHYLLRYVGATLYGELSLNNSEQMKRIRNYIGPNIFDSTFENAANVRNVDIEP